MVFRATVGVLLVVTMGGPVQVNIGTEIGAEREEAAIVEVAGKKGAASELSEDETNSVSDGCMAVWLEKIRDSELQESDAETGERTGSCGSSGRGLLGVSSVLVASATS